MLKPTFCQTIYDYVINTFVPYISSLLRQVKRVNLVCDRYFAESLTNCTREKRGVGDRRKVTGNCLLHTNWMTLLRYSENKAELLPYLLNVIVKKIQDKVVVSTVNENRITSGACLEISSMMTYNMEEPDERIFVHVEQALGKHAQIMIKTVDGNVVVIAIANFHQLLPLND